MDRGYFPKELPPPFTTSSYASRLTAAAASLPKTFHDDRVIARVSTHNLARAGTLRRRLAVPNPIPFYNLCGVIETNWSVLDAHVRQSALSLSYPVIGPPLTRALVHATSDLSRARAKCRASGKYLIRTDLARFYHSIYTHSIPWALHAKAYAKRHRRDPIVGNMLDLWVRNGQDGQTLGIPVGPDSSLLIAEAILSAVDTVFLQRLPHTRGIRFIDDYELCFPTRATAEAALATLQELLAEYELALNPDKTEVKELPVTLESTWVTELRQHQFRSTPQGQASDILSFFDRATELALARAGKSVVSYAIARLLGESIHEANWDLLESLLLQWVLAEPGTFPYVLRHFAQASQAGWTLDRSRMSEVMSAQVREHAPIGNGSEVAWALWMTIAFDLNLDTAAGTALSTVSDSFVAVLALDAQARGRLPNTFTPAAWATYMRTEELYGEQWLLAYEANVKGWLPSIGVSDHVAADPNFGFLKALGVTFYDSPTAIATLAPIATYPLPLGAY